jgi:hypothetical protein
VIGSRPIGDDYHIARAATMRQSLEFEARPKGGSRHASQLEKAVGTVLRKNYPPGSRNRELRARGPVFFLPEFRKILLTLSPTTSVHYDTS